MFGTLGHFYAQPLVAQVRAAFVQNVDEPGRNPFQEGQLTLACNLPGDCAIVFPAVPAGKRLVVNNVSANIDTAGTVGFITFYSQSFRNPRQFLPTSYAGTFEGINFYVVNQTAQAYYEAGEAPRVDAFVLSRPTDSMFVSISGYYINVP